MDIIKIDGINAVVIGKDESSLAKRDGLLEQAAKINGVTNEKECASASEVLKQVVGLKREVEKARKDVKAPALELGRKIDAVASEFSQPIEAQENRLRGIVSAYLAEQARIAEEAEQKRRDELKRIEDERHAAEELAQRVAIAAQAARLESERKAREATTRAEVEAARAEQARIHAEQEKARIAAEEARIKAEEETKQAIQAAPAPAPKPAGISVKKVWKFEVIDVRALAAFSLSLVRVEPDVRAIQAAIDSGVRAMPGLRIYETTASTVRM